MLDKRERTINDVAQHFTLSYDAVRTVLYQLLADGLITHKPYSRFWKWSA